MCNRYVPPSEAEIKRFWHIGARNQPRWAAEIFPRALGPFIRPDPLGNYQLTVGQWGLIPFFAKSASLPYSTNNARFEEITRKASYKHPWANGQRCLIPAMSFDEPCWETGRNIWWRFKRKDGNPWALAGLWNDWTDRDTGEIVSSYTLLTINADSHPIMSRMHKPDPTLPADQQDKRSVIAIEPHDWAQWLSGTHDDAAALVHPPNAELIENGNA